MGTSRPRRLPERSQDLGRIRVQLPPFENEVVVPWPPVAKVELLPPFGAQPPQFWSTRERVDPEMEVVLPEKEVVVRWPPVAKVQLPHFEMEVVVPGFSPDPGCVLGAFEVDLFPCHVPMMRLGGSCTLATGGQGTTTSISACCMVGRTVRTCSQSGA